jgi:hypothetical protein
MKHIHHLKASWLFAAMIAAVIIGEIVGSVVCRALDVRCPSVAIAAISVGLVAAIVSALYDGRE